MQRSKLTATVTNSPSEQPAVTPLRSTLSLASTVPLYHTYNNPHTQCRAQIKRSAPGIAPAHLIQEPPGTIAAVTIHRHTSRA